jgi:glycosyltransferase involved in cell wall biosynthesis
LAKKNRIIWITTQFPKGKGNQSGMFIYRTVKELSKYYSITVFCLYPKVFPVISIIKNLRNFGAILYQWKKNNPPISSKPDDNDKYDVIYIKYTRPPRGKLAFLEAYFAYMTVKKRMKHFLETENIILHANWLFPEGKTAELLSKKFNIPYIITLRGSDVNNLKINSYNYNSAASILKNSSKITSVSEALLRKCSSKNLPVSNKESITHNFYEMNKFVIKDREKARESIGVNKNSKMIFFAGSIIKIKNIDILIESVHRLWTEGMELQLYIAGAGYEEKYLKNLVSKKEMNDKVFFVGSLNPEELIEYYNAADLFCLVSKSEGLPNVVVESLLCGTPVVVSAVGELPFIIKEGKNGFLAEPISISSLSEKIKKSFATNWDRNALRESMNFLFPDKVLNEYKKLYGEFGIK